MVLKELLNGVGTFGGDEAELGTVAVEDTVEALGDHVEVEVGEQAVDVLGGESLDVVLGADETVPGSERERERLALRWDEESKEGTYSSAPHQAKRSLLGVNQAVGARVR